MRERRLGIPPLIGAVRVAVDRKQTATRDRAPREVVVEILPRRIAIELDRHTDRAAAIEYLLPIRGHAGTRSVHAAARMAEDVHAGRLHGAEHARGLIVRRPQRRMRRRHHDLDQRELAGVMSTDRRRGCSLRCL